jgi:hypothetical protein
LSRTFSRRTRVVGEAVGSLEVAELSPLGVVVEVASVGDPVEVMIH